LLLPLLLVLALLLLLPVAPLLPGLSVLLAAVATTAAVAALATLVPVRAFVARLAALRLAPRLRLFIHRGLAGTEQAEDAAPQAGAARLRGRGGGVHGRGGVLRSRLALRGGPRRAHVGDRGRRRHVEVGLGQRDGGELARGAALVARPPGFLAEFVLADPGDLVVRRVQLVVGDDHDRRIVPLLDGRPRAALLVQQVVRDLHRGLHQHLPGVVLHRVLLGDADYRPRQRFDAAHAAVALAAGAHDLGRFAQARAQPLARHLQQAEARDAPELHPCAVGAQCLLQAV